MTAIAMTQQENNYWIEVRDDVRRLSKPILVPLSEAYSIAQARFNFRSVYAYDQTLVEYIRSQGNTRGLDKPWLYSDCLFIDIDNDIHIPRVLWTLDSLGISYEYWTTGNRGGHFHIPIKPMSGTNIPGSQLAWIKSVGLEGVVDTSMYNPTGQIRMPLAIHKKTKGVKHILYTYQGTTLAIPPVMPAVSVTSNTTNDSSDLSVLELWSRLVSNLTSYSGYSRHQHLMMIARDAAKLQLGVDAAIHYALLWNRRWAFEPLIDREVESHVKRSYK